MSRLPRSTVLLVIAGALSACGRESTPTNPSGPTSFLAGTWRGTVTIQVNPRDPSPPPATSGEMTWTFEVVPQTNLQSFRTTIRSAHPWLTMETMGTTALSPGNSAPTQISTHGDFNSPRGCRGTFGSVGDTQATRIEADFTIAYWQSFWRWYHDGGFGHVAAWLTRRDISAFNAKAPPPKTEAFWAIVTTGRAPEDSELADALDKLENPAVVTLDEVKRHAGTSFVMWLHERKNRRLIPHRFEACGYTPVRNPASQQGLWQINGTRQVVYGRRDNDQRDLVDYIKQKQTQEGRET